MTYLMNDDVKKILEEADAIVIGAGAGLSAAAGFEYGGKTFLDNFKYMHDEYGYNDMYSAGFHDFDTNEEYWGYWSKMIYLNRYKLGSLPLYQTIYNLVNDKNYFVITTNVDHQFQLAGFNKERLFYMQGDYGLFQCSVPCHQKTYDNEAQIKEMLGSIKDNKISKSLIPRCPKCGSIMIPNLRCDNHFVEDLGWHNAKKRYDNFIKQYKNKKIVFLELGVGFSTPVWIKYPFINMTYLNKAATYICVDNGYVEIPNEIKNQSLIFHQDINEFFDE